MSEHSAAVVYVLDRAGPEHLAYYSVVCTCGWFVEPVDCARYPDAAIEQQMATAARLHDPFAEVEVFFPIDDPTQR